MTDQQDPIKLAREALSITMAREGLELGLAYVRKYEPVGLNGAAQILAALAALDAIPQPAPVPADAELDDLQGKLRQGLAVRPALLERHALSLDFHETTRLMLEAADALSALRTRLAEVEGALAGMVQIVEGINGAINHGTWRDDKGMRLKDTPEWVTLYLAAHRKLKEGK